MVKLNRMWPWRRERHRDSGASERRRLLPRHNEDVIESAIPAKRVTKVALRLKYLVEQTVSCEMEESVITKPHSRIITPNVVKLAREAGGSEDKACVVYCLLICKRWFWRQAKLELFDADLHEARETACEIIAKRIIESEEDVDYLCEQVLLKRYSILQGGEETAASNVIEKAVDLHALNVIGSSGYQKCVDYLWRGWLIQDEDDPSNFIRYKEKANTNYWAHFDPDRMRTPTYQNSFQIIISFVYLALYTGAINTVNRHGDLDIVEILLYICTFGFIFDEISKLWKVGRYYIGFWNVFNVVLYSLLAVSFITRLIALSYPIDDDGGQRAHFNSLSYNFLAFAAPMFWMRLLLYLDSFKFFGTMIVVLKVMMQESLIFFALLIIICIGFLQGFIGMDLTDNKVDAVGFILKSMANSLMQSPDFDGFDTFSPPFGLILYYLFTFIVMVVLLNILIALYNSAYTDITDNAVDEYMALFSQKTMQFVRAPDENVFIAPFNLIEVFLLILPFEWWMSKAHYEKLNDYVMGIVYSPLLLVTAFLETRSAQQVRFNRSRGEDDDDRVDEWDEMEEDETLAEGWKEKVEDAAPDVESTALGEVKKLRKELDELKSLILSLKEGGKVDSKSNGEGSG